ncbi:phage holin family protein [Hymenobacter sp. 5516J-16]|uniref:phage holin family protein n=1 Tax=Hymenobacter sp. 5516J-16 TaxID=2932253 RepID=UPI001FD41FB8|nr:phage holin family protein [Hymenobacter sp. 5516J-16]UOQ78018.1 phage holin family protein [Hymenobacter sp. 5516J-16]
MATSTDPQDHQRVVATYTDTPLSARPGVAGVVPAVKRISWGAILAGAVLALVIQLALSLLGLGIGLGTVDPLEEQNPMAGIGIGAAIWWVVSMLVSLYLGATVASRLAGIPRPIDGLLHGLLTWSVVTLLTFYLLSTAVGRIIGGVTGVAGRALTGAGRGIAAVAPEAGEAIKDELQQRGIDVSDLKREARLLLRQTGKSELNPDRLEREAKAAGQEVQSEASQSAQNPQGADDNFDDVIDRLTSRAENIGNAADRDAAVNVVMRRTGKSRAESEQIVDNWISTAQQARVKFDQAKVQAEAKARQTGDQAAEGLSKAALLAALGLGLGAAAAAFGGRRGVPHDLAVAGAPVA